MASSIIISTTCGVLKGQHEDGLITFRGVPFAQPPTGKLRFKRPVPTSWSGIREAFKPGPASYQVNSYNMAEVKSLADEMNTMNVPGIISGPPYVFETYDHRNISEDCLYLDIWMPDKIATQKLFPVFVYYHGGANIVSSGSFEPENGANLARQENVIVVRPNYRLGALGWVHFGLISEELCEAINLGLADQISALKWVHSNIAAFGGDPDNITVGGESAGATAVSHLLVHPETQVLIRRAIIQSLSPFNAWCTQRKDQAGFVCQKYLELLDIHTPSELVDIKPEKLLAAHSLLLRYFPADANLAWSPSGAVIDGLIVPDTPSIVLAAKSYPRKDFELMIGFAKDEWQFFRGHSPTMKCGSRADVVAVLAQIFGGHAAAVLNLYQELYPDHNLGHLLNDVMSMEFFKFSSLQIGLNFSAQQIPVYVFQFSFDLEAGGGAIHTGDMPIVFRNHTESDLRHWRAFDGTDPSEVASIAAVFGRLYGSFLRHGCPVGECLWPAFDKDNESILWVGKTVEPRKRLLTAEMTVFEQAGIRDLPTLYARLIRNVTTAMSAG